MHYGQTRGSVDLSRLAELAPAAGSSADHERDGTMASASAGPANAAQTHDLLVLSVADIIQYRLDRALVECPARGFVVPTVDGPAAAGFPAQLFHALGADRGIWRFTRAIWDMTSQPWRVQTANFPGDAGAVGCDSGAQLRAALKTIDEAGRGVLLFAIFPRSATP